MKASRSKNILFYSLLIFVALITVYASLGGHHSSRQHDPQHENGEVHKSHSFYPSEESA